MTNEIKYFIEVDGEQLEVLCLSFEPKESTDLGNCAGDNFTTCSRCKYWNGTAPWETEIAEEEWIKAGGDEQEWE